MEKMYGGNNRPYQEKLELMKIKLFKELEKLLSVKIKQTGGGAKTVGSGLFYGRTPLSWGSRAPMYIM